MHAIRRAGATALLAALFALPGFAQKTVYAEGAIRDQPIPSTFFGMVVIGNRWPPVPIGSLRVRASWKDIEPERGKWDFAATDAGVQLAEQHNVDVLFGLGLSPAWASSKPNQSCQTGPGSCWVPSNIQEWKDYLKQIAIHYKGRVHYYQVWNEPSEQNFYRGTPAELVRLTEAAQEVLKQVDPNNMVLSPAPIGPKGVEWMAEFLRQGGGKYFDILAFHFYTSPVGPESLLGTAREVRGMMERNGIGDKPVWDTEEGWIAPPIPDKLQAAYVPRILIMDHLAGIERVYWYIWGEPAAKIQMMDRGGTLTPAAQAYATTHQWLLGAALKGCATDDVPRAWQASHSMWECNVWRDGLISKIVWNTDGDKTLQVPPGWEIKDMQNLAGEIKPLPPSGQITVGEQPVFLRHR